MLSKNEYCDYYWWAELQVTFRFVSRIVPVKVILCSRDMEYRRN